MTFRSGLNYTIQQSSLPNPEPACEGQGAILSLPSATHMPVLPILPAANQPDN